MNIILIISILLLITVTIEYVLYRRQVQDICRQLRFLMENSTNRYVRTDITKREILELSKCINELHNRYEDSVHVIQKKDKRLKETIAFLSHDIRTPLTSLKGYFQLLLQEKDEERRMQYGKLMRERMDILSDLLEGMFEYTKLQNEDYRLVLAKQDMTRLVLETLFSFYQTFREKGIEPVFDVDERTYMVCCNDVAVKRVLTNIIRNAMVHGAGEIRFSYGICRRETEESQSGIYFECRNTILHPEEVDIDRIFDSFYKADKARTRSTSGLGLAVSKELMERMQGSITAALSGNVFSIKCEFPVLG